MSDSYVASKIAEALKVTNGDKKDAVKLFPLLAGQPGLEVWAVPLEQKPAPGFWHQLDGALNRLRERLSFPHGRQTA